MKKLLSFILAMLMLLSLFSVGSFADEAEGEGEVEVEDEDEAEAKTKTKTKTKKLTMRSNMLTMRSNMLMTFSRTATILRWKDKVKCPEAGASTTTLISKYRPTSAGSRKSRARFPIAVTGI